MDKQDEIYHCHARKGSRKIDPGHWFFDARQWAHCARAWPTDDGRWILKIESQLPGKTLLKESIYCASIDQCIKSTEDYFGCCVIKKSVRDMPNPDEL